MVEASFIAAFAGGLLSLLAPCSALLLPAFFAYAFANRTALLRGTLVFLCGLCSVLLPLGLAASVAGQLFVGDRQVTIIVSGLVLIALGIWQAVSGGFAILPRGISGVLAAGSSGSATYVTGVVYGLTGFCSGPLLGSVLTLAATGESPLLGASYLLAYAIGMVVPLFVLAAVWDRYALGRRRWLRGSGIRLGRISLYSTNLVAGGLFVLLGASFIASQGGALLSATYDDLGLSGLGFRLQAWLASAL
ncbi:MAG: cytochrome c biogenesis protein CcdA [Chloroflexi bacterium]|nr:MAG: cytochrome c biogenesis protein CcdA [Chloroflexota bacterium]